MILYVDCFLKLWLVLSRGKREFVRCRGEGVFERGKKGFPLNDEAGGAQDREICSRYVEMESC